MPGHRRPILATLFLALAVGLAACDDGAPLTEPAAEEVVTPAFAQDDNAATTTRFTFEVPFPPNPDVDFAPVFESCLGLDAPLRMSGTWTGWVQVVLSPAGRAHITEHIDYGAISITTASGDRTWTAGPGASEPIILNVPATLDARGAFTVRHEFHVRFVSQDGEPDLRVEHRVEQLFEFLRDEDGEVVIDENGNPEFVVRKNEFVPFAAECIGGES